MPYVLRKQKTRGYKVCKRGTRKCFSKRPLTKRMAKRQMRALYLHERVGSGKSQKLKSSGGGFTKAQIVAFREPPVDIPDGLLLTKDGDKELNAFIMENRPDVTVMNSETRKLFLSKEKKRAQAQQPGPHAKWELEMEQKFADSPSYPQPQFPPHIQEMKKTLTAITYQPVVPMAMAMDQNLKDKSMRERMKQLPEELQHKIMKKHFEKSLFKLKNKRRYLHDFKVKINGEYYNPELGAITSVLQLLHDFTMRTYLKQFTSFKKQLLGLPEDQIRSYFEQLVHVKPPMNMNKHLMVYHIANIEATTEFDLFMNNHPLENLRTLSDYNITSYDTLVAKVNQAKTIDSKNKVIALAVDEVRAMEDDAYDTIEREQAADDAMLYEASNAFALQHLPMNQQASPFYNPNYNYNADSS
jgi:hypothetical protein